ncbi:MAG: type II toxin-antitoxin system VapC family toxin [Candidatus Helarchaeota archaeon]
MTNYGYDLVELKKILDSNILIYSLLENHPASDVCEAVILSCENKFEWVTSPITFIETYYVLINVYGQEASQILQKIRKISKTPIIIITLDKNLVLSSLEKALIHQIDTNDSILLQIGIDLGISIIATDDKKLIETCNNYGIICENPITEDIREEMRIWEQKNLPEKGIRRIYFDIYKWLYKKNAKLADEFKVKTKNFTRLIS